MSADMESPDPRRIVVLNNVSTARGGATGLALLSVRLFRSRGIPVTYFASDSGRNPDFASLGVDVVATGHDEAPLAAAGGLWNGLFNSAAAEKLSDWISKNDTPSTVYHLHGWTQGLSPSIFGPLGRVADRLILHAHDYFLACPNGAFYDYRREEGCERVPLSLSCLTTNCDKRRFIHKHWRSVRHALRRFRFDINRAKIVLIHEDMGPALQRAGIDPAACTTIRNPIAIERRLRITAEDNRKAIFVGRLQPEKGIEDALAGAVMAGIPMAVVGDGPLRSALETKYPNAEFFGWQSHENVQAIMQNARISLMPSRYPEPFGMVCLEAIGSGVPVILPPNALLSSDVARNRLGYVVDTKDTKALAAVLTTAFKADGDIKEMSERGYAMYYQLCNTPDEWAERLLEVYHTRLAANGAQTSIAGSSIANRAAQSPDASFTRTR